MSARKLSELIAEELLKSIERSAEPVLPSVSVLSTRFKVSRATVLAAAGLLRDRGIIDYAPGRRMRVVGRHTIGVVEDLFERLRTAIAESDLRAGDTLPKSVFMARKEGVSNHTVLRAYRMLEEQKLAHRRGNTWVVGPPDVVYLSKTLEVATIVVLEAHAGQWGRLGSEPRTAKFGQVFRSEAERRGIRLLCIHPHKERSSGGPFEIGVDQISSLVRRQARIHLGTLVVGSMGEYEDPDKWVDGFLRLGRPVVWFDRYGESHKAHVSPRLFTRCGFSEEKALQLSVSFLHSVGHRAAGYWCDPLPHDNWRLRRAQSLCALGEAMDPPLRLTVYPDSNSVFARYSDEQLGELIAPLDKAGTHLREIYDTFAGQVTSILGSVSGKGSPKGRFAQLAALCRKIQATGFDEFTSRYRMGHYATAMLLHSPVFANILSNRSLSALIAPNDERARHAFVWFATAGIDVPGRVSLLSFDNYSQNYQHPVTTIDFGFDHLGYNAFHAIVQDTAVKKDRSGTIYNKPYVVHRGSVGLRNAK